jgi:hypothetical protein
MFDGSSGVKGIDDVVSGFFSFDIDRFVEGDVSVAEQEMLKRKLVHMYVRHVSVLGKELRVVTDKNEYDLLRKSGELFAGDRYYIFVDAENGQVLDMSPVVHAMKDTDEAFCYSCVMPR